MANYNLTTELRTDRHDRLGKCMIRIRAVINGKNKYASAGIKVHPKDWDPLNQCVKHTAGNAGQLNFKLSQLKLDYLKELLDIERMTGSMTEAKMGKVLAKENTYDFHGYAARYFQNFSKQNKKETIRT